MTTAIPITTTATPITTTATPITMMAIPITTTNKESLKMRHELKHLIHTGNDKELSSRLQKLFPHDKHADSHGTYRVSSLYFDTPYDKALRQKIDGINRREKFRIRYYNDDLTFLRLEKKMKINGLCAKISAPITAEQVRKILNNDVGFLLNSSEPLFIELYSKWNGQLLRPKNVVTYDREAFLYKPGNVRITLDRRIRTLHNYQNFLNPNIYHLPASDGLTVLEVKYDNFLPELVRLAVQIPNRQAGAYSKYGVCRRFD